MTARWRLLAAIFLGVLAVAFAAAWIWWLLRPPTPGPLRLTKTSFSALPGWNTSDPRAALAGFLRSCAVLAQEKPATPMGGAGYAGTAADWRAPCQAARNQKAGMARAFFQQWFLPVEISAGRAENGLFTGYYEPQLRASRTRHGRFQTPVYGVPGDLVSVDLGAFRPSLHGEHIAGRVDGNRLVPYATRADIDAHGLPSAPVLFYADDPIAVFFLHIQGSGRVRFEDGTEKRVSYAAQNGQLYTPIGRVLIERGALTRQDLSMQSIRAWLLAHPAAARSIMEADASYIFFKEEPIVDAKLGARGAQGVPLTPGASLAVDTRLHALGVPYYVSTTYPDNKPLRSLFIAQDIGGAIRGPVRADIFFGFGKTAEQLAGGMKQRGRLYVLLPKSVAARLAPRTDYPATMP